MAEEPSPLTNATPPDCEQKRRGRKKREREKRGEEHTKERKRRKEKI